MKMYPLLN